MKIAFIGGGLEPGADGVGDYMRTVGAALVARGVEVRLLALNDGALCEAVVEDPGNGAVGCLRLPASWTWERRLARAEGWLAAFGPDWVSVQCVVFSFDARGLPFGLGTRLARLAAGRKVHVMFHEIAMGFNPQAGWRHRLYGRLQRRILQDVARRTRPLAAHTTTAFYQEWLAQAGIATGRLPLHGNVPVVGDREAGRRWLLDRPGTGAGSADWLAGFFGGFSPMLDRARVNAWLAQASRRGRGLVILAAGRIPPGAEIHLRVIERAVAGKARLVRLGALSAEDVSRFLHGLDEGLTSYPEELLGKSGAVAAMWAHGLGVTALGALRGEGIDPAVRCIEGSDTRADDTAGRLLAALVEAGGASA